MKMNGVKFLKKPEGSLTFEERRIKIYNSEPGELTGYDCNKCKNRGYSMILKDGKEYMRECECMTIRRNLARIERSGLGGIMNNYTFDSYQTSEPWQKQARGIALDFVKNHKENWFFAGGQVGCGKTHLCTAIVRDLIIQGVSAKYMLWRDEGVMLKAAVTDSEKYSALIKPLKEEKLLYIDDFFKTERGKKPTAADINIAAEIINYRYINPDLITIISSERTIDDITDIDEAVGSRIYERSRKYCLFIDNDKNKNYRMKGMTQCD